MKMLKSQKHVFWEALVITLFIFGLGILLGIFIENGRTKEISDLSLISEMNLLDVQIQTNLLSNGDINCDFAIKKNIEFANKIFEDSKQLDRYEGASRLGDSLVNYHKRYDLLRTLLWLNSVKIKKICGEDSFDTLVYLYNYQSGNSEELAMQNTFSKLLEKIKQNYGKKVILIPIAKNLNVSSLDILLSNYDVEGVSVILNEKQIFSNLSELKDLKNFL